MLHQTSPRHLWSRCQNRMVLLLACALFMGGATTIASAARIDSAAKSGNVARVEALLEKTPSLLESRTGRYRDEWTNTRENTPLHIAAVYGRLNVVEFLLERGATVDARNDANNTPLHFAAMHKHREVAELLLAKGADPSAEMYGGGAPLHLAVLPTGPQKRIVWRLPEPRAGTELVELLLAQGVDINVRNDRGNTPLHTAAWITGTGEVIELLLAQGADTNMRNNSGETPLMLAERYGQQANAELLRVPFGGAETPLSIAAAEGNEEAISVLIRGGADVNGTDSFGRTALMFASEYGYLEIVRELVAAGADENVVPTEEPRWPALLVATQNGHGEVVQLLVANEANVGYRDQNNTTAIELAYNNGHSELARFLIEAWPGPLYRACLPIETEQATADGEEEPNLYAHFICRVRARGCKTDPDGELCRLFLDELQLDLPAIDTIAPW